MKMCELWTKQTELYEIADEYEMRIARDLNTWTLIDLMLKAHKQQVRQMQRMGTDIEEIREFRDAFAVRMAAYDISVSEV